MTPPARGFRPPPRDWHALLKRGPTLSVEVADATVAEVDPTGGNEHANVDRNYQRHSSRFVKTESHRTLALIR